MVDLTNCKFGRLTVVGFERKNRYGISIWRCQCDCGNKSIVASSDLRSGNTQSCGCLQRELIAERSRKHGLCYNPRYTTWSRMKSRCLNPNFASYPSHGGRGIRVCQEWIDSFETFNNYVKTLPGYDNPELSLDRLDNNGHYEPGNVRWATKSEQQRNKRNNQLITFNGKTQLLRDWAVELNLNFNTLSTRFFRGWSDEEILERPIAHKGA